MSRIFVRSETFQTTLAYLMVFFDTTGGTQLTLMTVTFNKLAT